MNARNDKNIYSLIVEYNMTAERIEEGLTMLDNLVTTDRNKTEFHGLQLIIRGSKSGVYGACYFHEIALPERPRRTGQAIIK